MPKFNQANGLTVYAFACGYLQVAKYTDLAGVESEVKLSHLGGNCYAVHARQFGGDAKTYYIATESIGNARKMWLEQVTRLHGDRLKAVKADKRYSVSREFCGASEQQYIARFEREWLGKSDTKEGAALLCAKDKEQRMDIADCITELEKEKTNP